jgi:hypothetical protein
MYTKMIGNNPDEKAARTLCFHPGAHLSQLDDSVQAARSIQCITFSANI